MHQVFPRPLCPTALQSGDAVKQLQAILVAAYKSSQAKLACLYAASAYRPHKLRQHL